MPQEPTSRPRLAWWWDGAGRGEGWAWLLGLAAVVVAFSLGALVTAGGSPIRGVALANLLSGLGVALLPTLVALRRLDRGRHLGAGEREVRRAWRGSLAALGLVDEDRPAARRSGRLPPVRPAWWYRLLAGCWGGFVLLSVVAAWVTARELLVAPDPAEMAFGFAVVALPFLLAWLVVGLVALGKAARVAHWQAARAKAGRTARAPRQPLVRRLAAGPRWVAGAMVAAWHGLGMGVVAAARWVAGMTVAGWRGLVVGVVAGARWVAGATVAGGRGLGVGVVAGARWVAGATVAGWHLLVVGAPPAARRAADATLARWHGLQFGLVVAVRWAAAATMAGWHGLQVGVPPVARWVAGVTLVGWHRLEVSVGPVVRRAAAATPEGWHHIQVGLAAAASRAAAAMLEGWRGLKSGVAARAGGRSGQPLSRRLADDGRRGAGVTLARWRDVESGSRR